jgi:ribosomal RNA-processing protein 17
MMLGKRRRQTVPSLPKKRKKSNAAIEVISFDQSAREDYLTGFHKRKLQRAKHAQEEAAKREKEERIAARKIVRAFPLGQLFFAECIADA